MPGRRLIQERLTGGRSRRAASERVLRRGMAVPSTNGPASAADSLQMLEGLVGQCGQDHRARQQAALLAFGRRSSAAAALTVLLHDAVCLLSDVLGADWQGIGQLAADGATVEVQISAAGAAERGPVATHTYSADPNASLASYCIDAEGPVVVEDLGGERRFDDPPLALMGVASALAVPLALDGRVFGMLAVYSQQERHFTARDAPFAETIGHMLAPAIGRFHAQEELKRVRRVAAEATRQLNGLRRQLARRHDSQDTSPEVPPAAADVPQRSATPQPPAPDALQRAGHTYTVDMRSSPRRAYHYRQKIAPIYGGCIPARKDFFEVECRDISAGGIAFYLPRQPDFDSLVVSLGRAPKESYFTARVVRTEPVERSGQRMRLVGCCFTGRIQI